MFSERAKGAFAGGAARVEETEISAVFDPEPNFFTGVVRRD